MKEKIVVVSKTAAVHQPARVCAFCNLILGQGEGAIAVNGAWVHGGCVGENCFRRLQPAIADMVVAFLGRYCVGLDEDRRRLGQVRGRVRFYALMREVILTRLADMPFSTEDARYNRKQLTAIASASLCDFSGLGVPMLAAVNGEGLN